MLRATACPCLTSSPALTSHSALPPPALASLSGMSAPSLSRRICPCPLPFFTRIEPLAWA